MKRTKKKSQADEVTKAELERLLELRRLVWVEEMNLGTIASALDWVRITISHYPPRGTPEQHYLNGIASMLVLAIGRVHGTKAVLREASRTEE